MITPRAMTHTITVIGKVAITASQDGRQTRITFGGMQGAGKTLARRAAEAALRSAGAEITRSGDDWEDGPETTTDTLVVRRPPGMDLRGVFDTASRAAAQAARAVA